MHTKRTTLTCLASALLTPLTAARVWAQEYPVRSIRIVVPFAPGGPVDFIARALSSRLTQILGQSVIVDNKPGASTIIGTDNVAKASPDGYSMLLVGAGSRTILPAIAKLPYDPAKDLQALSKVAAAPQVFVVSNAFAAKGVKNLKDLVSWSKSNPGKLTVGSVGGGTITSLVGDLFKKEAGIQAVDVVYKGGAPAVTAILSGEVDFLSADISAVMPHLLSRKMMALAVTGPQRVKEIADVATVAEQGFPNLIALNLYCLYLPAGTPQAIVQKLNQAITSALAQAELKAQYEKSGMQALSSTPLELEKFLSEQSAKWLPLAKASGAVIN